MSTKQALAMVSLALLAVACGADGDTDGAATAAPSTSATTAPPVERGSATPRLALSYDGGLLVYDARTLGKIADIPVDGFTRLNAAGNGRHVFVSRAGGFGVLDMGTWTQAHGDHGHYYTAQPAMTDLSFGGAEPGHVVPHDGAITLFSDGTGQVDVLDPDALLAGKPAQVKTLSRPAHHGVAVSRADGTVVVSVGDAEKRTGATILDANGAPLATAEQCPGVHGEAAAADGVLTLGCQDGILIVRGNDIRKVASPDAYGRIGNQAGSDESPVVLGDYKTDPDAEVERPRRFTLTDTATGTIRVVPIDASYSFRSLDRGPEGEAVILGTDGFLHVFDPVSAARVAHVPAIGAWTEPDEWQSPMPNLHVQDGIAYVSDPNAKKLVAVNLASGEKVAQADLPQPTIELTGVEG